MKVVVKTLSLVPMAGGFFLLWLSWSRYRLPYEDGRYFDPQTATIYHQQTAEVYLVVGVALAIVGLSLAFLSFRECFLGSR